MFLFNYETNSYLMGYLLLTVTIQRDNVLDIRLNPWYEQIQIIASSLLVGLDGVQHHPGIKTCIIYSETCLISLYIYSFHK